MSVPYEHLNVRHNPFGELTETERTQLAEVDVTAVCEFLKQPKSAVQFVGEKGFGKTTHLLVIRQQFSNAGYVHIPEGERADVPAGCPVLIDEAQRLTWRQRRQVFPRSTPLVLGTHRDFSAALRRAGRIVQTIHVQQSTSVRRLQAVLQRRIEFARRDVGDVPTVSEETATRLLQKYGPDLRSILGHLYDAFESLQHIQQL